MFKLIDKRTGEVIKRAKHSYTLIDKIDELVVSGKGTYKDYKVVL